VITWDAQPNQINTLIYDGGSAIILPIKGVYVVVYHLSIDSTDPGLRMFPTLNGNATTAGMAVTVAQTITPETIFANEGDVLRLEYKYPAGPERVLVNCQFSVVLLHRF
jgi:hypothetical protein